MAFSATLLIQVVGMSAKLSCNVPAVTAPHPCAQGVQLEWSLGYCCAGLGCRKEGQEAQRGKSKGRDVRENRSTKWMMEIERHRAREGLWLERKSY